MTTTETGTTTSATAAISTEWDRRSIALWLEFPDLPEEEFRVRHEKLIGELPEGHPVLLFERGALQDSTGHSDLAVPLYQQALAAGLDGERRRRVVIQMSSSLRNMGRPAEGVALLRAERERGSDHLDDAISATLALCLVDTGHEREAVAEAVAALAPHLPRYQRSMANYARLLMEPEEE
ncbi:MULTISPECIES: tetratricopeptide repeat protein [Streptacidiphilus]|uniref:Tetratricopeptide repeat protein n=1 Tax=Streptacidiphilus cavernicola TaxID=3342716 RepID=A0ABV6UPC0_9ACTN|nr:tetratricopeptide repeat protein [Streptacidiphilus jeojiense]